MARTLLVMILAISALVVASRLAQSGPPPAPPPLPDRVAAADSAARPAVPAAARPHAVQPAPAPAGAQPATSVIDRMARLESRRRVLQSLRYTYLDSLFTSADSMTRRWPDRPGGAPIIVAVTPPPAPAPQGAAARRALDAALRRWEALGLGFRFRTGADTTAADIVVQWVDRFEGDRTGQADLQFDEGGLVHHARITLALRAADERPLSERELGIVATHEVGHALGLPHSGVPTDVMFPTAQVDALSPRDRATITLLYSIVPGPLHQPAP